MPLPISPLQSRYTRQQVAEATGIDADLLAYWTKEGLLIAAEGEGLGKGKHRLFGFESIHIAAVLQELGRYGVQTSGLKQMARLLWGVVAMGHDHPEIDEEVAFTAGSYNRARRRYPDRSSLIPGVEVEGEYDCFEDWLEDRGPFSDEVLEIAAWFDDTAELAFALYHDLFTENIFESVETRWMFARVEDQLLAVPEDLASTWFDQERARSYVVLNLSLIIKPIWML